MKILATLLTLLLSLNTFAQSNLENYKIYDTKKKAIIGIDEIVKDFSLADVLFFGEEHNDSIGHDLEYELFKKIAVKNSNQIILTLEMFPTDVQTVINEYLQGLISEKNFIKEARAWNNYKDYKPLIEFAKAQKIRVIAGNVATRYSNAVTFKGITVLESFDKTSKAFLPPLPIDTATGRYYEKFTATLGGHAMGNMKIYQTQNLWDASMAWNIFKQLQANKNFKVLNLNGRFHSDEKLGIMAQLKKLNPKIKILNISAFSSTDFESPDWNNFMKLADYIIITNPNIKRSF